MAAAPGLSSADMSVLFSESDDEALFESSATLFRGSPRTPSPARFSAEAEAALESSISAVSLNASLNASLSASLAPRSPSPTWVSREASERRRWERSTPVRQRCEGTPLRCALPDSGAETSPSDRGASRALAFDDDDDDDDDATTVAAGTTPPRSRAPSRVSDEHRAAAFGSFNDDDGGW